MVHVAGSEHTWKNVLEDEAGEIKVETKIIEDPESYHKEFRLSLKSLSICHAWSMCQL